MTKEFPLFPSIESALLWAWYFARWEPGIVKDPAFAKFIANDSREQIDEEDDQKRRSSSIQLAPRPGGLDAAAQAGMIKGFVDALPAVDRAHLKARMLRTRERSRAQRELVIHVIQMTERAAGAALTYELISKHYGKRGVTMAGLAKKYKLDRRKITSIRRQIEITLDAISYRSETAAYERLQKMGVVA